MVDFLLAIIGGAGLIVAPVLSYRALNEMDFGQVNPSGIAVSGASAFAGVIAALYLAFGSIGGAFLGLLIGAGWLVYSYSKRAAIVPDIVVDEPLLRDAEDPELRRELEQAAAQAEADHRQGSR